MIGRSGLIGWITVCPENHGRMGGMGVRCIYWNEVVACWGEVKFVYWNEVKMACWGEVKFVY